MKIDEITPLHIIQVFRKKAFEYILFFLAVSFVGIIYTTQLPNQFTSFYLLAEKGDDGGVNLDFGNLGFLGRGVQKQDTLNFKEKIDSNKFFNQLLLEDGFMEGIFLNFGIDENIEYVAKENLINNQSFKIHGKNKQQLKNYFKNELFLFLQTDNTYQIGITHQNPKLAKNMIEIVYKTFIDTYVKEEMDDLERQLNFFRTASSQEKLVDLKDAYSSKIIEIMNSIYILKGTDSYFYVLDSPQISSIPSGPNRMYLYLVFFIATLFLIALHSIYHLMNGNKENK